MLKKILALSLGLIVLFVLGGCVTFPIHDERSGIPSERDSVAEAAFMRPPVIPQDADDIDITDADGHFGTDTVEFAIDQNADEIDDLEETVQRSATFVIAASDATQKEKAAADYLSNSG